MRALPSNVVFRLVGTTFAEGYPNTVYRVIELLTAGPKAGPVPARLHRVPSNEHDPNAVAVICVAAGGRIGWVPRELAARLAPMLDAGYQYEAELLEHVEHPEHPANPGINVRIAAAVRPQPTVLPEDTDVYDSAPHHQDGGWHSHEGASV